jgi:hypothetical protein
MIPSYLANDKRKELLQMVDPASPFNPLEVKQVNEEPKEILSSAERDKIGVEERYRAEIREYLLQDRRGKSRVWTFVNSTFGIWLFSAILISWGGTLYTQSQNRRAERLKQLEIEHLDSLRKIDLVEKLDLEIGYRLSQMQIQFALMSNWMTNGPPFRLLPGKTETDVKEVVDTLGEPPKGVFRSLYGEFSNFSTIGLIAELRRHVPAEQKKEIDNVIADVSGIYIRFEVDKVKRSDVDGVARSIFKNVTMDRWRKGSFYFTECPFC